MPTSLTGSSLQEDESPNFEGVLFYSILFTSPANLLRSTISLEGQAAGPPRVYRDLRRLTSLLSRATSDERSLAKGVSDSLRKVQTPQTKTFKL